MDFVTAKDNVVRRGGQADDLYELISERAPGGPAAGTDREHGPRPTGTPCSPTQWSLLDRLINTSHQVLTDGPSYRPNKRPQPVGSTTTQKPE